MPKIFEMIFWLHGQEKCECSNICNNRALNIVEFKNRVQKWLLHTHFQVCLQPEFIVYL